MAEMSSSLAVTSAMDAPMSSSLVVTSAMDAPMSSSLGAMGPLLRKLDSLLPPDYRLPKLLKEGIELLKADLEEISVPLLKQSMVDSPNEMARYWMNEVRELCYDIEDFIDNMMSTHADAKMSSVRSYKVGRVKIAWLPKTLKPCTRAAKVAELRTLVQEASERHNRYLDGCTSSSRRVFTGHGPIPALYAEAANNPVGVDDSKVKLIKWLADEEEQHRKVVAIVGPAGVGKTALARQVYREVGEKFECWAFVRASRKPDMRRLLGGILFQVQQHQRPSSFCTVQNLIDNLTKHLQDKRYFIVIDDLWETTAWDVVISAFPEGNNRSRIVTTTEIEEIAMECCDNQSNNILKMKPLGGEDSSKLLVNLVFGPEHLCPETFRGYSDIIITKCAGLPLATTFVAGLLTTQPNNAELCQHVQECLRSTLSTDSTLEETLQEIVKLSYNSLPHYLKTCLMYLTVYPEGYTLWKIDLVKHWIAEGFICTTEGTDTGEVADSYFEELVTRGMIQPVDISYNGEVLSCTLHHIVLDLIALESTEERFITTLDYSDTIRENYIKARRLSLHFSNTRYATKPTGLTLSKVRSICFFGIPECVPTILEFKHLRILFLEFWGNQRGCTTFNLTKICRLFQLRYLKISCDASVEVELPTQMRMLRYLETLIVDAAVSAVPLDIVNLPSLLHLSLGDRTDLPHEIGCIRSLRTLHCFDLSSNSEENILSLGNLMNLQDLHLTCCTEKSNEHLKRNLTALASSLGKLVNLKSVTLDPGASGTAIYHDVWSSMSCLPIFLQRLEFLPPICIFSRLPKCIGQLRKLHTLKVVVSKLLMEDMDILIGLPALTILSLYVRGPTAESIIFRRGAFLRLKYFKYTCGVLSLAFQEEAFPNLQRLELSFNAHRGEQYDHLLLGIDYLLNVKEIAGTIGAAAGADEPDRRVAESAFRDAIRKHPRFPSYDNVKRVDWVCEEYQLTTQEKELSSENYEMLQTELGRKEGDSSDDQSRIVLKEIEEETELHADRISHFPTTGSIIPFDQMKTDMEEDNAEETDERFTGIEGELKWWSVGENFEGFTGTSSSSITYGDDASSTTTESMFYISPECNFRRKIKSWCRGLLLGSGSFGMVYEGITDEGLFFAVKEVSLLHQGSNAQQSILALEHEVDLLSQLEHENIVHYYGTDKEGSKLYIFTELVTQGSLSSLYRKYKLRDSHVSAYTRQILNGLVYLHERNVVHRDIKCANILVHANGSVKLADFGLAKEMSKINVMRSCKASVYWMAPEVVNPKKTYRHPADIWSVGCTVLEMLTRQIPYPNVEWTNALFMIGRGEQPPMPSYLSKEAQDFIGRCVRVDPDERPTASELLAHPFVHRPLGAPFDSLPSSD